MIYQHQTILQRKCPEHKQSSYLVVLEASDALDIWVGCPLCDGSDRLTKTAADSQKERPESGAQSELGQKGAN